MKIVLALTVLLVFFNSVSFAEGESPVVRIYSKLGAREALGTGFFFSQNGDILTAYHVVKDAKQIDVYHVGKRFENVLVVSVLPEADLAHLKVDDPSSELPFFPLDLSFRNTIPGQAIKSIGHSRGLHNQHLPGHITQAGTITSDQVRDQEGNRLFKREDLELLPLDMTIYSGHSGGPVLLNGRVIAVLSGSFNEGGSIGWGIPISYQQEMLEIGRRATDIVQWPEFRLMAKGWSNLRRTFYVDKNLKKLIEEYYSAIDEFSSTNEKMSYYVSLTRGAISLFQDTLNAIAELPAGQRDGTLRTFKETQLTEMLHKSLGEINDLSNRHIAAQSKIHLLTNKLGQKVSHFINGLPVTTQNFEALDMLIQRGTIIDAKRNRVSLQSKQDIKRFGSANAKILSLISQGENLNNLDVVSKVTFWKTWLQSIDGQLQELSAASLTSVPDYILFYQEKGEMFEALFFQDFDRGRQNVRYSSHYYSLEIPSGWTQLTPKIIQRFSLNPKLLATATAVFTKIWLYGEEPSGNLISIIEVDYRVAISSSDIPKTRLSRHKRSTEMGMRSAYQNLRNFQFSTFRFQQRESMLIAAEFGSKQNSGEIHNVYLNGPNGDLEISCQIYHGVSFEDCPRTINSVKFHQGIIDNTF